MRAISVFVLSLAAFAFSAAASARRCSIQCADGTSCSADDGVTQSKSARDMARDAMSHRNEIAKRWPEAAGELNALKFALASKNDVAIADSVHRLFDKVPAEEVIAQSRPKTKLSASREPASVSCMCATPSAERLSQADCAAN